MAMATDTGTAMRAIENRAGGTAVLVAIATAVAFGLLYRDVIARLVHAWQADANYSHGFLITPLCAYIAWQRRHDLTGRGSWLGVAGMAASFTLLVGGELGAELFLTRVSMVAMLAALTLLLAGWRGVARLA